MNMTGAYSYGYGYTGYDGYGYGQAIRVSLGLGLRVQGLGVLPQGCTLPSLPVVSCHAGDRKESCGP